MYDAYFTKKFSKKLEKTDDHIANRIRQAIDELSNNPYHKSEHLKGPLKGIN